MKLTNISSKTVLVKIDGQTFILNSGTADIEIGDSRGTTIMELSDPEDDTACVWKGIVPTMDIDIDLPHVSFRGMELPSLIEKEKEPEYSCRYIIYIVLLLLVLYIAAKCLKLL